MYSRDRPEWSRDSTKGQSGDGTNRRGTPETGWVVSKKSSSELSFGRGLPPFLPKGPNPRVKGRQGLEEGSVPGHHSLVFGEVCPSRSDDGTGRLCALYVLEFRDYWDTSDLFRLGVVGCTGEDSMVVTGTLSDQSGK